MVYLPAPCPKTRCSSSLKFPGRRWEFWVNETRGPRRGAAVLSPPLRFCPNSSHLEEKDVYKRGNGVNPGGAQAFPQQPTTHATPDTVNHRGGGGSPPLCWLPSRRKHRRKSSRKSAPSCSSGSGSGSGSGSSSGSSSGSPVRPARLRLTATLLPAAAHFSGSISDPHHRTHPFRGVYPPPEPHRRRPLSLPTAGKYQPERGAGPDVKRGYSAPNG